MNRSNTRVTTLAAASVWFGVMGCGGSHSQEPGVDTQKSVARALSGSPDFFIQQVVSEASSAGPDYGPLVRVTVCNRGTQSGAPDEVDFVLSQDALITPGQDTVVYDFWLRRTLVPGECTTIETRLRTTLAAGTWFLGAIADPHGSVAELDESNNTFSGGQVTVGSKPDFVVQSVSGPASGLTGQPLKTNVTVCNQGTVAGIASSVWLVLSPDEVITRTDRVFGWTTLTYPLYPGHCIPVSLEGRMPAVSAGAWYLGAYVDPDDRQLEILETNNGRGTLVGVGSRPDLTVTGLKGAPQTAALDAPLGVDVTVCNQGTASSVSATPVEVFLSQDATLSKEQDFFVGGTSVGALSPGACTTVPLVGKATVPAASQGELHLAAIVDSSNTVLELIESNNAFVAGTLGVGNAPDFVVTRVKGPTFARMDTSLAASVTVCNQGTVEGSTEVDLALSKDAVILPAAPVAGDGDIFLVRATTQSLKPGQCQTLPVTAPVSLPYSEGDGEYHLGAIVDPRNTQVELLEHNNTRAVGGVGIGEGPDFVVQSVSAPSSIKNGEVFSATVTVCNQGTTSYGALVQLGLESSLDPLDPSWGLFMTNDTGSLPEGECIPLTFSGRVSLGEGAYHLVAVVDPHDFSRELIESNNEHVEGLVGVGGRPDFVVSKVSGPSGVKPGESFSTAVTVCNQGTTSGATGVSLLLSSDADLVSPSPSGSRLIVKETEVGLLDPGACTEVQMTGNASLPEGTYYLGAIADRANSVKELIETNNAFVDGQMGIGSRPDFTVKALSGPAVTRPGESFRVSFTVCNPGNLEAGTDVSLLLSRDKVITVPGTPDEEEDVLVGGAPVEPLEPGACRQLTVEASVPTAANLPVGEYHLAAIVDPRQLQAELLESNNVSARIVLGVGHAPDFVVTAVQGVPSAMQDTVFTASVTVCNQGTSDGDANVVLVLSSDKVIFSRQSYGYPDYSSGWIPTEMIPAGQCITRSLSAYVSSSLTDGPWYLGAVVDPYNTRAELFERNNTLVGDVMGIGSKPDFIVTKVAGPSSAKPGEPFTASATVCNQGTVSGDSQVTFFLSEDEAIAPSDLSLTSVSAGSLTQGTCTTVSARTSTSLSGVARFLGAIVTPVTPDGEFIENNNSRVGERVGFGDAPDFIVTHVTGPANAKPGEPFTASATVCNQGTVSGSTDVQVFLSSGDQLQPLGLVSVGMLGAGQCTTVSLQLTGAPEGSWHLGAIADPLHTQGELVPGNNTYVGGVLGVGEKPDLVIREVTAPASVWQGDSFSVSVTVCNQGTLRGTSDVEIVLSPDGAVPPYRATSAVLGTLFPPELAPGQCTTEVLTTSTSWTQHQGAYRLDAVVDPSNHLPELIESNNTAVSDPMGVGHSHDFFVKEVSGPATARPGAPFSVSATVCNQGLGTYPADIAFVLSADENLSLPSGTSSQPGSNVLLGRRSIPDYVEEGQCVPVSMEVSTSLEGAWYLGAIVNPDKSQLEFIGNNNTRVGQRMGLGLLPDFVIKEVSGPANARPGGAFTASATVCNQGTVSGSTDVRFLLSRDEAIVPPGTPLAEWDVLLGSTSGGTLVPGQCATVRAPVQTPSVPEGGYYLGAEAVPVNGQPELLGHNNTRASGLVEVGSLPDFHITAVTGPASHDPGWVYIKASATVCNQGTVVSGSTDVSFFLSADAVITAPGPQGGGDTLLSSASVGALAVGQCTQVSVSAQVPPVTEGPYHLGALVDPSNGTREFIEDNNARAGDPMGIGHAPDFIVTAVTRPESQRSPESAFTSSVTVCNQGTAWGSPEVALFLSPEVNTPSSQDVFLGSSYLGHRPGPDQCVTVPLRASFNRLPEGKYTLRAVVDPSHAVQELLEGNNTYVSGQMTMGFQSDLTVQSVTGPSSVEAGSSFRTLVTVCNEGTADSITKVQLLLSGDEVLTPANQPGGDWLLGSASVGQLPRGQCATVPVSAQTTGLPEGVYHLGALVDPHGEDWEFREDNNTREQGLFSIGSGSDFVITKVTGPETVTQWTLFPASVTVCNQGTRDTYGEVELVLSQDTTIAPPGSAGSDDLSLASAPLFLMSGACESTALTPHVPVSEGVFHLGAITRSENLVPELITSNDTFLGGRLGVGDQADLVIQNVSVPARMQLGATVTASVTVCNQGATSTYSDVELVLSEDRDIRSSLSPFRDIQLASAYTYLPAGQCTPVQLSVNGVFAPTEGGWYVGAIVDVQGNTPEIFEDNNVYVGPEVSVGTGLDFAVTKVVAPGSVVPGENFQVRVDVCNQGDVAGSTRVDLVLSSDTTLIPGEGVPGDVFLGSALTNTLSPGQCGILMFSPWTSIPPALASGGWYLGAIADPDGQQPELLEGNNALASDLVVWGNNARAGNTVLVEP
ncbi:CARDB domain-containing protein [Archangium lipolyticum]|uniref:CARDB domain-containing protein n=1 Tax=Archangium lipolyticum TaxID=2970465 RepID=UPI002149B92B|nr:CARDB domain-containing protein [Archangium lipolyticum]